MRLARDRSTSTHRTGDRTGNRTGVGVVPSPVPPDAPDAERWFIEAYQRLHSVVLDHASLFLDRESARDAVSQAEEELWIRKDQLSPEQRTDRYFFVAVRNTVFDALKQISRLVSFEDAEAELDQIAVEALEEQEGVAHFTTVLDRTLAAMPPRRREVFLLIREHNLSYKQVAAELGISVGTINTHYGLAARDLRIAFTRAGFRIAAAEPLQLPSRTGEAAND